MTCLRCGKSTEKDDKFCRGCGFNLKLKLCGCGVVVNEHDSFCYNCGKKLKSEPLPPVMRTVKSEKDKHLPGRRFWTQMEDDLVKEMYANHPNSDIADIVGRSANAVQLRARKLGLVKSSKSGKRMKKRRTGKWARHWTLAEENLLKGMYRNKSYKELARDLGRSVHAVQLRASKLGLSRKEFRISNDKIAILVNHIKYHSWVYEPTLIKRTRLSPETVRRYADYLVHQGTIIENESQSGTKKYKLKRREQQAPVDFVMREESLDFLKEASKTPLTYMDAVKRFKDMTPDWWRKFYRSVLRNSKEITKKLKISGEFVFKDGKLGVRK